MMTLRKKLAYWDYRFRYVFARHLNHKTPIDVSLELSSLCNMSCAYCYHNSKDVPFEKGFMSRELALKVLLDAAICGTKALKFNYRGEATLNPDFLTIVQCAKELSNSQVFIDRVLNSNFKFPVNRREEIFEGLSYLTKVKVSYDSFRKEVFESQRSGGNHDLTTSNIDAFYASNWYKKSGVKLVIQAVRTAANKDEDIPGICESRWPGVEISIRDMVTGRVEKDLSELQNRTRLVGLENRQSCIQAHARLIVHHDGRVGPCCPSIKNNLLVGDVKTQSIRKIWNSQRSKELRKSLKNKTAFLQEPCKSCPSFESFKGYKAPWDS